MTLFAAIIYYGINVGCTTAYFVGERGAHTGASGVQGLDQGKIIITI